MTESILIVGTVMNTIGRELIDLWLAKHKEELRNGSRDYRIAVYEQNQSPQLAGFHAGANAAYGFPHFDCFKRGYGNFDPTIETDMQAIIDDNGTGYYNYVIYFTDMVMDVAVTAIVAMHCRLLRQRVNSSSTYILVSLQGESLPIDDLSKHTEAKLLQITAKNFKDIRAAVELEKTLQIEPKKRP